MFISYEGVTVGETSNDLFLTEVELDLGDLRTGDVEWPLRHGSRPGVDYLESGSLTLTLCTSPQYRDEASASGAVSRFLGAWRRGLREGPGRLAPLHVSVADRERVVWGRPGRVAPPAPGSTHMQQGAAIITAEFRVLDPNVYAADSSSVSISVVPKSLGGIVTPIITPVTTALTSDTSYRFISVDGDADAPFSVTFHGPCTDPKVVVDGVEVGIVGKVEYDEDVTVDGRARTVELADGSPAAARMSRGTRIDRMKLTPGEHEISFTATDRTGTATATVSVTPAFYHL